MQDVSAKRVDVHKPTDLGKLVEQIAHVFRLCFGEGRSAVENVAGRIGRCERAKRLGTWREGSVEVPQEIIVAIWVNADLARLATAAGRVPGLWPHRIRRLAVVAPLGVHV